MTFPPLNRLSLYGKAFERNVGAHKSKIGRYELFGQKVHGYRE